MSKPSLIGSCFVSSLILLILLVAHENQAAAPILASQLTEGKLVGRSTNATTAPVLQHSIQLLRQQVTGSQAPRSNKSNVLQWFNSYFSEPRGNKEPEAQRKAQIREGIIEKLKELGFQNTFVQKSNVTLASAPGEANRNMISILPGRHRQTKQDRLLLVGAHWDTVQGSHGVDDNGSGSVCLLEIARLVAANKCSFNHTIMLVWFDNEEIGKVGSQLFVNDYLYPMELDKYGSKFIGAYVMDMILVRDRSKNSQVLPIPYELRLPEFNDELKREEFRGDFLVGWARKVWDEPLMEAFRASWLDLGFESRTFKTMQPDLPQLRLPNLEEREHWGLFFRSDHASFWYPPMTASMVRRALHGHRQTGKHASLSSVLLTDLGPWRKEYSICYHAPCDDKHLLTDDNLAFMQQVIDSLMLTVLRVGQGECNISRGSSANTTQAAKLR